MLKAILHGKAGRIEHNKDESVSWSQLFKTREDLLTSTIFERFAYLTDAVQHALLMHWFKQHHGNIPLSFGEFIDTTYWQRFNHQHDKGSNQVEPDLILHFEHCNIIVEVKPPAGGNQYFWQWCKEIESFLQAEDDDKRLYFLAIGRVEHNSAKDWANELLEEKEDIPLNKLKGIAAINWDAVTAQLVELISEEATLVLSKQDSRIIQDMLDGLGLYGQQISPFKWSQLTANSLSKLGLIQPRLISHPTSLTHQADVPFSLQSLPNHSLGSLDLQRFQSAL
ncbi:hypothetical protein AB4346_16110, partial [Vibrio breoganii]